ncbi:septum formation initiator family protein [Candidatus Bipolaricaulota bacterium]|nr:septum formation initiator family protein [Candidatus Bipolaricaulota bacterium]
MHHPGSHAGRRRDTKRRRRFGALILILTSVSLLLALFIGRDLTIRSLRRDVAALEADCSVASIDQMALREALSHADDSSVIEEIARRELGLIYPGEEKVYFLEDDKP